MFVLHKNLYKNRNLINLNTYKFNQKYVLHKKLYKIGMGLI